MLTGAQMFDELDLNNDGVISMEELEVALRASNPDEMDDALVAQMMSELDSNNDGVITFPAFVAAMSGQLSPQDGPHPTLQVDTQPSAHSSLRTGSQPSPKSVTFSPQPDQVKIVPRVSELGEYDNTAHAARSHSFEQNWDQSEDGWESDAGWSTPTPPVQLPPKSPWRGADSGYQSAVDAAGTEDGKLYAHRLFTGASRIPGVKRCGPLLR